MVQATARISYLPRDKTYAISGCYQMRTRSSGAKYVIALRHQTPRRTHHCRTTPFTRTHPADADPPKSSPQHAAGGTSCTSHASIREEEASFEYRSIPSIRTGASASDSMPCFFGARRYAFNAIDMPDGSQCSRPESAHHSVELRPGPTGTYALYCSPVRRRAP